MKKFSLVLGKPFMALLVLALAFGLVFVSCDDGTNNGGIQIGGGGAASRFTLTNIPEQYNGKYVYLQAQSGNYETGVQIAGFQNVSGISDAAIFTLCRISNGSVSIPVWNFNTAGGIPPYTGNDYFAVTIMIVDYQTLSSATFDPSYLAALGFLSVPFTNGSATRSWSQADIVQ